MQSFAAHYGTVILPTRPRTPRHKGKIERGVDYVQENALKGRTFQSLAEQNAHLAQWEAAVADTRIHGTTREQVGRAFRERERAALLPLPAERFPCFQEAPRTVHRNGHVSLERAFACPRPMSRPLRTRLPRGPWISTTLNETIRCRRSIWANACGAEAVGRAAHL